ncbi:MAG: nitroreductase family protein [Sphaerochaetaceae bacterium]|jgi:nitroreductase|nr:nitroreductase family protein [Sphaerochaetaceae bacterium]MDY0371224.1 nitroreductase family protein [Sphaerochaetaceae bacterium]
MNQTMDLLHNRRTHRSFTDEPISSHDKRLIQEATLRAPTAGNMMYYSVLEITDQVKKDRLALLCDNQPMIATAPLVWLFLSDARKWVNYYHESGSVSKGEQKQIPWRAPGAGDLLLAMSDALIAAQSAVIAAESLGIGSCYIGDILENSEQIISLFNLPQYTAVATLVIFGHPKNPKPLEIPSIRCPIESIFMENTYQEPHLEELQKAFGKQEARLRQQNRLPFENSGTIADYYYFRKHTSDFMQEMDRSSRVIIERWLS